MSITDRENVELIEKSVEIVHELLTGLLNKLEIISEAEKIPAEILLNTLTAGTIKYQANILAQLIKDPDDLLLAQQKTVQTIAGMITTLFPEAVDKEHVRVVEEESPLVTPKGV